MTNPSGDYVLGTGDEEIERLGLQHRVWRPRVLDAWSRAGLAAGQHVVDIGCGPGYATMDLAALTGPAGRVTAIDRSPHFLDALRNGLRRAEVAHVDVKQVDLDGDSLPALGADAAWCRWILAFVADPRRIVREIHAALKPNGVLVLHEYFDYRTWRLMPRCAEFEEFVGEIMAAWRATGGEPDIALDLVAWLTASGFETVETRPHVDVVGKADDIWRWPSAFVESGLRRLVELGRVSAGRAGEIRRAFEAAANQPSTRMITPAVLEIIARRK
jgi:SAM-dependent methyltransferase